MCGLTESGHRGCGFVLVRCIVQTTATEEKSKSYQRNIKNNIIITSSIIRVPVPFQALLSLVSNPIFFLNLPTLFFLLIFHHLYNLSFIYLFYHHHNLCAPKLFLLDIIVAFPFHIKLPFSNPLFLSLSASLCWYIYIYLPKLTWLFQFTIIRSQKLYSVAFIRFAVD